MERFYIFNINKNYIKKFNSNNEFRSSIYRRNKFYNIDTKGDKFFDVESYSSSIANIVEEEKANLIVVSSSADGRYLGPILSVKVDAAYISNVVELPLEYDTFKVKRSWFTNKAFNVT